MNAHWWNLLAGIALIIDGSVQLVTGSGGSYWGVPVPFWSVLIFLPSGIVLSVLSVRALWRGEGKDPTYTEKDAVRAREKLDRMYLREHGTLPGTPESQTTETPAPESAAPEPAPSPTAAKPAPAPAAPAPPTPEQTARIAKTNAKIRQGFLLMLAGAAVFYAAGGVWLLIPAAALFLVGLTRLAVGLVERS